MVAFASCFEPARAASAAAKPRLGETAPSAKKRIRRFFPETPDRVGESAPQVVDRVGETRPVGYDPRLGYVLAPKKNWSKDDCDKLAQNISDAKLSRAAYDGVAPAGWQLGETWTDAQSGFKAREFLSDDGSQRIIGFAGTEAEWGDVRADAQQAVGQAYTPQYEFANALGRQNRGRVTAFVGHSLGGGLAHVAGGSSGTETATFNAAGLHPNTISFYNEGNWMDPTNIHTANDILTIFQSHQQFPNTTGNNVQIPNSREKGFFEPQVLFNGRMHGINEVIGSLQQTYDKNCK